MTVDWRRPAWLGAIIACLAASPAASEESRDGRWRPADNPYRSRVELRVSGTEFSAHVGCTAIGLERTDDGKQIGPIGAIVHEGACFDEDRSNPRAAAYWNGIIEHLIHMRWAEVRRGRLVVRGADGTILVFVRAQGR